MAKILLGEKLNSFIVLGIAMATVLGGFFVSGGPALAARDITSVTLNGTNSVTVKKGASINVSMTVESTAPSNWASTAYKIGKAPWVCVDTANHKAGTIATESFVIKASGSNGAYAVLFKAYGGNVCKVTHSSPMLTLVNGILVNSPADTIAPELVNLTDDTTPKKTKEWNWCSTDVLSDITTTFRFVVDQNPSGKPTRGFSKNFCHTELMEGNGTYYLHVEAKDRAGNMSEKTVSAVLTNVNNAPTFPTDPRVEDKVNPLDVTDTTPEFSVVFNDPDNADIAMKYRLMIKGSDKSVWDSGTRDLPGYPILPTFNGQRTVIPIEYDGPALVPNTRYGWVIKLWDKSNASSQWMSEGPHFVFVGE